MNWQRRLVSLACSAALALISLAAAMPAPVAAACESAFCATLTVEFTGSGTAHAVDDIGQIDCSYSGTQPPTGTCTTTYAWPLFLGNQLDVNVTVTPNATSYNCGGGVCLALGQPSTDPVTLIAGTTNTVSQEVRAAQPYTLTLDIDGNGTGHVTSNPAGLDCSYANGSKSGACSHTWYFIGSPSVTAFGQPTSDSYACFVNPPGCAPVGKSLQWMSSMTTLAITFNRGTKLAVAIQGKGEVLASVGGLICPPACTAYYKPATPVALTASPAAGYLFRSWAGACSGSGATCNLTMGSADLSTTAVFATPATPPPPTTPPSTPPSPTSRPTTTPTGRPTAPAASPAAPSSEPEPSSTSVDVSPEATAPEASPGPVAIASAGPGGAGTVGHDTPIGGSSGLLPFGLLALLILVVVGLSVGYLAGRRRTKGTTT